MGLGIGHWGSFGLLNCISKLNCDGCSVEHIILGVCMIIIGVASASIGIGFSILLIRIHRLYRHSGISMAQARSEIKNGLTRNKAAQDAATMVANEIVTDQ